jgi:hypothetical protein
MMNSAREFFFACVNDSQSDSPDNYTGGRKQGRKFLFN